MEHSNLPYNSGNILLQVSDVCDILKACNVHDVPKDIGVYRKAFVHRSYCTRKNENFLNGNTLCPDNCLPLQEESNERLEFLGDSVINLVVAQYIFRRYKDENEGFLTKVRTKLVNGITLASFANMVGLSKYMIISKQIEECEGRNSKKLLEDSFEAFVGALFIDFGATERGFDVCSRWFVNFLEDNIDFASLVSTNTNFKDKLLKHFQFNLNDTPRFFEMQTKLINNVKYFTVCVKDKTNTILGVGKGGTKKEAENNAAQNALTALKV